MAETIQHQLHLLLNIYLYTKGNIISAGIAGSVHVDDQKRTAIFVVRQLLIT